MLQANNPHITSWIKVDANSDFPIQNLPFGIFQYGNDLPKVGSRIGDYVIDIHALYVLGYLKNLPFSESDFKTDALNSMMKNGKNACSDLRNRLSKLFVSTQSDLEENKHHVDQVLVEASKVKMLLPIQIGDYTDFYSSREHATNVGSLFRDPENALKPNWLWLPVGYHGRASSIIVSEQPVHRPKGQIKPNPNENPIYAPCRKLDFELETAFVTFDGKQLGDSISTAEAEDYIFGMVLFNDWSARDIQTWEYVPLGPFLAKSFSSSISPWLVTLDALQPFKVKGPKQVPEVLDYLKYEGNKAYDINLQVTIQPDGDKEYIVCESNFKHLYWNMAQQLAHQTVGGCNIRCGDVLASGTISGSKPNSFGSMLELSYNGKKPLKLTPSVERTFIEDKDTVTMRGYSKSNDVRIGFGEVRAKILPAK